MHDRGSRRTVDAAALLAELDTRGAERGHGQSTAVIVTLSEAGIHGASVGDSGAWLVSADGADVDDLTADQRRKPLVGDGCSPVAFARASLADGTLVVASDGLLRYAKRADIARIVAGAADLSAAARELIDRVRLRDGTLQDDVSVVLCRRRRM